jgi:hypothetical protein
MRRAVVSSVCRINLMHFEGFMRLLRLLSAAPARHPNMVLPSGRQADMF